MQVYRLRLRQIYGGIPWFKCDQPNSILLNLKTKIIERKKRMEQNIISLYFSSCLQAWGASGASMETQRWEKNRKKTTKKRNKNKKKRRKIRLLKIQPGFQQEISQLEESSQKQGFESKPRPKLLALVVYFSARISTAINKVGRGLVWKTRKLILFEGWSFPTWWHCNFETFWRKLDNNFLQK